MPIDIILYAIIAAVLVVWLRNTLGTIDDDEPRKQNPVTMMENQKKDSDIAEKREEERKQKMLENYVENKNAEMGLKSISRLDSNFNVENFLKGAQDAFVMIVEAFAKGDKDLLKKFLAAGVYESFEAVIDERIEKGEKVETEIHAVRKSEIIDAKTEGSMAFITIRFKAEETCVIKDSLDEVISGNPDKITEMVDVWVFGRDTKSNDPTWFVYETRDDEEEEHKTPMPEAKH